MGRGKGKARKLNGNVNHEDCGSGGEEKVPVQKKRGRPLKHAKEAEIRHGVNTVEKEDGENASNVISGKNKTHCDDDLKNGKRKLETEESEPVKEESGNETKSSGIEEEYVKPSGFRQNNRRRKNTPRRAAEAVVECN